MVDEQARQELASNLDRLISGEMTNDDFDELCYERWHDSADAAVAEIATFGYGLYSSDLPWAYKLKNRHAPSDKIREKADRAILFLRTKREYQWPQKVYCVGPFWAFWGPGFYLIVGLVLLVVASTKGGFWGLIMGLLGLVAVSMTFHDLFTRRKRAEEWEQYLRSGDFDLWPFVSKEDFEDAKSIREHERASEHQ